jgi:hypothetical protein
LLAPLDGEPAAVFDRVLPIRIIDIVRASALEARESRRNRG